MKENKRDFLEDLLREDFQYGVEVPPALNEKIIQAASRGEVLEEKNGEALEEKKRILILLVLSSLSWILSLAFLSKVFLAYFGPMSLSLLVYFLLYSLGGLVVLGLVVLDERRKNLCVMP